MIVDTEKIRTTIIVHGNVQRSDYRTRVISTANMMNITGRWSNVIVPVGISKSSSFFG